MMKDYQAAAYALYDGVCDSADGNRVRLVADALAKARRGATDRCACGYCVGPVEVVDLDHAVALLGALDGMRRS
jgi:hypothetical protein